MKKILVYTYKVRPDYVWAGRRATVDDRWGACERDQGGWWTSVGSCGGLIMFLHH